MKIKTIDITAKEWFDRVNGNSYFSAQITLNYGLKDEKTVKVPFQYGYGYYYEQVANETLKDQGYIKKSIGLRKPFRKNDIIVRSSKIENCLKVNVKRFGSE